MQVSSMLRSTVNARGSISSRLSRCSVASSSRHVQRQQPNIPSTAASGTLSVRPYATASGPSKAEVKGAPAMSQTNKAEFSMRRFWKTVNVQANPNGDFLINLDHRNLKTPGGAKLVVPKDRRLMALLIANEWENQSDVLKQHSLPVTSLASRAIDGLSKPETRQGVIEALMAYLDTDTIFFQEETPRVLVRMQKEHWDPLFAWIKEEFGVTLGLAEGFAPAKQDPETKTKMEKVLQEMDTWELAAFERAAYASKSFIIALALCRGRLTSEEASQASHVEVRSQIEIWGEVEDTHDVDYQDIRRASGSAACLLLKA